MLRVFLVRHGETEANRAVIYAGRSDGPLAPEGRDVLTQMARHLQWHRIDIILSSPQRRARDTAGVVASLLDLPVQLCEDLSEMEMGVWTGMSSKQIEAVYPDEWRIWRENPGAVKVPGMEDLNDIQARSVRWLGGLTNLNMDGKTVAAFTHEAVIRCLVGWVVGAGVNAYRRMIVPNCSVSCLEFDGQMWSLRSLNEQSCEPLK